MVNYALVGRCGIYCGSCGLYRAYRDGGEYLQQVSEAWEMPVEKILCEGCHALTVNFAGSKCKIVNCLNSRGFEYCYECPEYNEDSCETYEGLAKRWAVDDVDLRANLERIKTGAVEDWLKESEERFTNARARCFMVFSAANSLPFYMLRPFTSHYLAQA